MLKFAISPVSGTTNGTECWVAAPWKWASFMIPMYICLLINCGVFVMIVRVLIRAASSGSNTSGALGVRVSVFVRVFVCLCVCVCMFVCVSVFAVRLFVCLCMC